MSAKPNRLAGLEAEPLTFDLPQPAAPEVRTRPVKVSVALHPRPYYALVDYCADAAKLTGARVTHVDVMRVLVSELLADAELRNRVTAQLRTATEQVRK
jgi:hypothetical protein